MTRRVPGMLFALVAATAAIVPGAYAQQNPYREDGWGKLPDGRKWGQTSAIDIDRNNNVWVFERCGANSCIGSNVAPLVKLSPSGRFLKSFGAGMFAFPHGIHIDRAAPGLHHVTAIVFDRDGQELTRIAPRLVSVNMNPGY